MTHPTPNSSCTRYPPSSPAPQFTRLPPPYKNPPPYSNQSEVLSIHPINIPLDKKISSPDSPTSSYDSSNKLSNQATPLENPESATENPESATENPESAAENVCHIFRNVTPWDPDNDPRSCGGFLDDFHLCITPEPLPDSVIVRSFARLLKGEASHWYHLRYTDVSQIEFFEIVQNFTKYFWNEDVQIHEIRVFLQSNYAESQGQSVSSYVKYWLNRLEHNSKISHENVVRELVRKIPQQYASAIYKYAHEPFSVIFNRILQCERENDPHKVDHVSETYKETIVEDYGPDLNQNPSSNKDSVPDKGYSIKNVISKLFWRVKKQ